MNPAEVPLKAPTTAAVSTADSDVSNHDVEQVERALIDASTRLPVLFFYASAIAWLLLGTLLAGFSSIKLHMPDMLAD
jgi:cytochrome c oxidase cbb3-type subunit 1